jgi:ABC-type transport system involved in multi-copper enzyme maturation permease subunit
MKVFLIAPLFAGGLFLSIFASSNFIPNMLEKGNIEILLSKPLRRSEIILGKFLGVSEMVFVNIAYVVLGFWLLFGIKFGYWDSNLLFTILTITFAFCLLYSFIILMGILTRSSLTAMMLSYLIFFVFSPLLAARDKLSLLIGGEFTKTLLDFLYYITPNTHGLSKLTEEIASGSAVVSYEPVYASLVFMAFALGLAIFIFERKDF